MSNTVVRRRRRSSVSVSVTTYKHVKVQYQYQYQESQLWQEEHQGYCEEGGGEEDEEAEVCTLQIHLTLNIISTAEGVSATRWKRCERYNERRESSCLAPDSNM